MVNFMLLKLYILRIAAVL